MRRVLIVVVALIVAGCGGSNTPTAPAMPTANLSTQGNMTFSCSAFLGCTFQGEAKNTGQGCATNVRGVSRLLDPAGAEIDRADWNLVLSRKIRPAETFLYDGCCFTSIAVAAPGSYKTQLSWDDVGC
jgi:hypothetical protein